MFLAVVAAAGAGVVTAVRTSGAAGQADGWEPLFDGRTLGRWKPTSFGGEGAVRVRGGEIVLETGDDLTGITWTGDVPTSDYELALAAKRLLGSDFFCGLTFPVQSSHCSLIVGGWGGGLVGLSSLDGRDASENETQRIRSFEDNRWYAVRVRVTAERIQAWIDDEAVADVALAGRKIGIRGEVAASKPLGVAAWRTSAALKDIRLRKLSSTPA